MLEKALINSPVWVVFTHFRKLRNKSGSAINSPYLLPNAHSRTPLWSESQDSGTGPKRA